MKPEDITAILGKHDGDQGGLISVLQDIQAKYSYLPADALKAVAKETGRSLVDIYGIATFYRAFSLKPRGKHLISACLGTACHVRGGPAIADEISKVLGIQSNETSADREFTFETVNCLGACALGPIVVADGHYFSNVSRLKVKDILKNTREGVGDAAIAGDERIFAVEVSCPRCNHGLDGDGSHTIDGYPSIRVTVAFNGTHGWIRLSSLYGSHVVESEHDIPMNSVASFFCPYCNTELAGAGQCPSCESPMIPMIVRGGGIVQICSRRGCTYHMLDLTEGDYPESGI